MVILTREELLQGHCDLVCLVQGYERRLRLTEMIDAHRTEMDRLWRIVDWVGTQAHGDTDARDTRDTSSGAR